MPEGFNSVADLVVRVKAETGDLRQGLAGVTEIMKSLDSMTGGSLKGLVNFGEVGGRSLAGLSGTLTTIAGKVTRVAAVLEAAGEVARQVASAAGADDEMGNLQREAAGVQESLLALAEDGLGRVKSEAADAAAALGLYTASADGAGESTQNLVERGLTKAAELFKDVKLKLAEFRPAEDLDFNTRGEMLDKIVAQLDELKRRAAEADAAMAAIGDNRGTAVSDPDGGFARQMAALEAQAFVLRQLQAVEATAWNATIDTGSQDQRIARLADEVALLEKRANLIGVAASVSAAELARERFRIDADRAGVAFGPDQQRQLDELFARQRAAQAALDAAREAERAAELAGRQDQGADRVIANLVESIEVERQRRREYGLTVGQIVTLREEERALAAIRALGRDATEAERIAIRAAAEAKGREADANEQLRISQEQLQASADILGRSMESAFTGWIRGARTSWEELVAQLIADMAMLAFRQNVLQPLFGGGGSGAGLVPSLLGELFGGMRENGGPVEAGKAYIVGERRAELFIPNVSGRIEPSVGGPSITMPTYIDARGAGPNEVQELKRMMAERDAALPNQVLAVVREGRDRGVA